MKNLKELSFFPISIGFLAATGFCFNLNTAKAASLLTTISLPGRAFEVEVNPNTNTIYATNGITPFVTSTAAVIDGSTNFIIDSIEVGQGSQGIDLDFDTNKIYVVNVNSQTVSVIDELTNSVLDTIPGLEFKPRLIGVNPITNKIYVSNNGNGSGTNISVINADNNNITNTITTGLGPSDIAINPLKNTIYVTNQTDNTVSVIDGNSETVIATIPVGGRPLNAWVDIDKNQIYISNFLDDTISIIDGFNNQVIETLPLSINTGPRRIDINPNLNRLYVAGAGNNTLTVIDRDTNKVIQTLGVGDTPTGLVVNSVTGLIYVANLEGRSISVVTDSAKAIPESDLTISFLLIGTLGTILRFTRRRGV